MRDASAGRAPTGTSEAQSGMGAPPELPGAEDAASARVESSRAPPATAPIALGGARASPSCGGDMEDGLGNVQRDRTQRPPPRASCPRDAEEAQPSGRRHTGGSLLLPGNGVLGWDWERPQPFRASTRPEEARAAPAVTTRHETSAQRADGARTDSVRSGKAKDAQGERQVAPAPKGADGPTQAACAQAALGDSGERRGDDRGGSGNRKTSGGGTAHEQRRGGDEGGGSDESAGNRGAATVAVQTSGGTQGRGVAAKANDGRGKEGDARPAATRPLPRDIDLLDLDGTEEEGEDEPSRATANGARGVKAAGSAQATERGSGPAKGPAHMSEVDLLALDGDGSFAPPPANAAGKGPNPGLANQGRQQRRKDARRGGQETGMSTAHLGKRRGSPSAETTGGMQEGSTAPKEAVATARPRPHRAWCSAPSASQRTTRPVHVDLARCEPDAERGRTSTGNGESGKNAEKYIDRTISEHDAERAGT
jgi:hypothetical protein